MLKLESLLSNNLQPDAEQGKKTPSAFTQASGSNDLFSALFNTNLSQLVQSKGLHSEAEPEIGSKQLNEGRQIGNSVPQLNAFSGKVTSNSLSLLDLVELADMQTLKIDQSSLIENSIEDQDSLEQLEESFEAVRRLVQQFEQAFGSSDTSSDVSSLRLGLHQTKQLKDLPDKLNEAIDFLQELNATLTKLSENLGAIQGGELNKTYALSGQAESVLGKCLQSLRSLSEQIHQGLQKLTRLMPMNAKEAESTKTGLNSQAHLQLDDRYNIDITRLSNRESSSNVNSIQREELTHSDFISLAKKSASDVNSALQQISQAFRGASEEQGEILSLREFSRPALYSDSDKSAAIKNAQLPNVLENLEHKPMNSQHADFITGELKRKIQVYNMSLEHRAEAKVAYINIFDQKRDVGATSVKLHNENTLEGLNTPFRKYEHIQEETKTVLRELAAIKGQENQIANRNSAFSEQPQANIKTNFGPLVADSIIGHKSREEAVNYQGTTLSRLNEQWQQSNQSQLINIKAPAQSITLGELMLHPTLIENNDGIEGGEKDLSVSKSSPSSLMFKYSDLVSSRLSSMSAKVAKLQVDSNHQKVVQLHINGSIKMELSQPQNSASNGSFSQPYIGALQSLQLSSNKPNLSNELKKSGDIKINKIDWKSELGALKEGTFKFADLEPVTISKFRQDAVGFPLSQYGQSSSQLPSWQHAVSLSSSNNVVNGQLNMASSMHHTSHMNHEAPLTQAQSSTLATDIKLPTNHPLWAKAFNQRIVMMQKQQVQMAEIRLNPANMGPIKVSIQQGEADGMIQMWAANPQTRELMEQSLPKLKEMLAEQNAGEFNLAMNDFSKQSQKDKQLEHNQTEQHVAKELSHDGDAEQQQTSVLEGLNSQGRVDYFA